MPKFITFRRFSAVGSRIWIRSDDLLSMIMLPAPVKTVISGIRFYCNSPGRRNHSRDRVGGTGLGGVAIPNLYYEVKQENFWISVYITWKKNELSVRRSKIYQKRCISARARNIVFYLVLPGVVDRRDGKEIVKEEAVD